MEEDVDYSGCFRGYIIMSIIGLIGFLLIGVPIHFLMDYKDKEPGRIEKRIDNAVSKNDFVTAHEYLSEYAVLCKERYDMSQWDYEPVVKKVYAAEIRYLVSLNTEDTWNKAYMLPLEIEDTDIRYSLYKTL